ncbi:MAG: hypothetical protein ACRC3B_15825, partial [Bacteroidia bacterium]
MIKRAAQLVTPILTSQKLRWWLAVPLLISILLLIQLKPASGSFINHKLSEPPARIADTTAYPFIREEFNRIQFYSRSAVEQFYKAWNNTAKRKMAVVHLGDSHLQADIFPGQARKGLQAIHG